jgi:phosphate transport system substrate-binding protein
MMTKKKISLGFAAAWLAVTACGAWADTFTGAGSSAAAPIYRSWGAAYERATSHKLTYESAGSSAGVRKIKAREVGYGATDVAPTRAELDKDGLLVFPIAITGITPVVNLPRIADGQLRLNGTVLARIFMGQVAQWNAPEIAQLNPGLALPNLPIKVIVRSDGSGTTYNYTDYLAKVHPDWQAQFGVKNSITWPTQFIGAKGSEGVSKAVRETVGGISYVDFGYVRDYQLTPVQLADATGEFLNPSSDGFRTALSASDWVSSGNFTTTLTNMNRRGAWPITMGTFVVVPQVAEKPQDVLPALKFFAWSFMHGDELVQQSSFVRLPTRVQAAAFRIIASVKDKTGNPIGMQATGF